MFYVKLILLSLLFIIPVSAREYIVFGSSLPVNGIMKEWGDSVISGTDSYFRYVNETNTLPNKHLSFIHYDDKYEPDLALKNTKTLLNKDVFALLGFVGTPTVKSILPLVHDSKIPFIAPFTGAMFLRNTYNNNIINLRPNYKQEIKTIVDYLYKQKNITEFTVFYQNDDYGHEGYTSLLEILDKYKLSLMAEGTYKRNTLSINHAFNEIKLAKPKAVIMIGAHRANSLFIQKAKGDDSFKDTIFATVSFGDANAMIKQIGQISDNIIFSQVVPSYDDTSLPIIREYREIYSKYYPDKEYSFISLEAFISAKIVVNTLFDIEGSLTKDKFINNLKKFDKDIGGINAKYYNYQLLNKVYLFEYKNGYFNEIQ